LSTYYPPRQHSKLVRASKKSPCGICGATGWPCSRTADCVLAWCKNAPSDKPSRHGTYLHILSYETPPPVVRTPTPPARHNTVERADEHHVHLVYDTLLSLLPLRSEHRDALRTRRGLPDDEIDRLKYRSTPTEGEAGEIVKALSGLGLEGVPGFYSGPRMVKFWPGILTPYRNPDGLISGLLYRLDKPFVNDKGKESKCVWFSSADADKYPGGVGSGSPLHYSRPELLASSSSAWLTEGGMKSDISSFYLDAPFVSAAGVTQWASFPDSFSSRFPHVRQILLAFDADFRTKVEVRRALDSLTLELERKGFSVWVRTWPASMGKGIDDYLLNLSKGSEAVAA
jgi:hypothetical protein